MFCGGQDLGSRVELGRAASVTAELYCAVEPRYRASSDAKTRLVNLAIDDMDAPIVAQPVPHVGDEHDRLALSGEITQYAEQTCSSQQCSRFPVGLVGPHMISGRLAAREPGDTRCR